MPTRRPLRPHPDRLLPVEASVRSVARQLYADVRELPVVSPHSHVDPTLLVEDRPFPDPAALLVTPDHYVKRLLHASGVALHELGVGRGTLTEHQARDIWQVLCSHWHVFAGTPVRFWLESTLSDVMGVEEQPSAHNADRLYDQVRDRLAEPASRPRALFERFGISVLATTDDPVDDLAAHDALAADPTFAGRVVPTFRPDRFLEVGAPGWTSAVQQLQRAAQTETGTYAGYVRALEERRRYFVEHGATSADHSHADVGTEPLAPAEAARIYEAALRGEAGAAESTAFRRHMLLEMARMSVEDGLVMTLHPGVVRNHHRPLAAEFGPDQGHDIPTTIEYTNSLRPLLERFGTSAGFHLVLFTLDETVFSREIAPLAGFYPSVYVGAPWWFLDSPDAIRRWRSAVTDTAGFTRSSGFIDDTRAFCSIPARHDMSRRLDAGHLARLVVEHQLDETEASEIARALVVDQPTHVFKL